MNNNTNKLIPDLRFPEFANEGEWEEKKLGDMTIKVGSGVTPLGGESNYRKTGHPFVRSQNVGWGVFLLNNIAFIDEVTHQNSINTEIELEDVLLNITGASIGRSAVANQIVAGGNVNQHVCIIRTKKDIANPFFVNQFLISDLGQKQIDSFQAGGNRQGLNFEQIRSFIIPTPKKIREQQKIASCLSSLNEVIAAHTQKLEALKEHKKGLMQNLFPQEGETVPKFRFPEFVKDGEWPNLTLGEICKITSGGTPNRSNSEFWNGDIPWISTTLIDFNIITQANECITEEGLQNSSAKIFPKNTILMAMYGQGKTRGKVAILGIEAATNQACAAILLKAGYNTNYVFQYLAAHYNDIRELSNRGGQENLSGGLIEIIPITIPNFKEQQKIASFLSSLDALITAETEKIAQLKLHKKGLMQGLFPKIND